jgi:(p)ppGpp synthase/HD superfamily hydrolase
MSTLERAIEIAARAHAGQVDKAGAPYILHPLRVMMSLSTVEERIVGVLHDVVEDTDVTFDDLRAEGFSELVVEAVMSVTKDRPEKEMGWPAYEAFVLRAAANPIGRRVKIADMTDNMDLSRISNPTERDLARVAKYRKALALLTGRCQ